MKNLPINEWKIRSSIHTFQWLVDSPSYRSVFLFAQCLRIHSLPGYSLSFLPFRSCCFQPSQSGARNSEVSRCRRYAAPIGTQFRLPKPKLSLLSPSTLSATLGTCCFPFPALSESLCFLFWLGFGDLLLLLVRPYTRYPITRSNLASPTSS